jgi:hypothetical protein
MLREWIDAVGPYFFDNLSTYLVSDVNGGDSGSIPGINKHDILALDHSDCVCSRQA